MKNFNNKNYLYNFKKYFFFKMLLNLDLKINSFNFFFLKKKNSKFFKKKMFKKNIFKNTTDFIKKENNFFIYNFFGKFNNFFFKKGLKLRSTQILKENFKKLLYNFFYFNKNFEKKNKFDSYKNFFFFFQKHSFLFNKNYIVYFLFSKFKLNFELKFIKIKKKKFVRNFILIKYLYTDTHKFNVFCRFLKKNLKIFKKFKFKKKFFLIIANSFFSLRKSILYKSKASLNQTMFNFLKKIKYKNLIF